MAFAPAVQDLIDALGRLPGVGPKSAQRIAFHLLKADAEESNRLAAAVLAAKERIGFCELCFNLSEHPRCEICSDERRDAHVLCVVEEPRDVVAIERTREFRGRYHVLHGAISPLDGVGPDQLRIRPLLDRLRDPAIAEIVLATDPDVEGDATALYIKRLLQGVPVRVTRIAHGLSVGTAIEYADALSLARALTNRRDF